MWAVTLKEIVVHGMQGPSLSHSKFFQGAGQRMRGTVCHGCGRRWSAIETFGGRSGMRASVQMSGLYPVNGFLLFAVTTRPTSSICGRFQCLLSPGSFPCCATCISQRLVGHTLEGTGPRQTMYGTLVDLSLGRSLGIESEG